VGTMLADMSQLEPPRAASIHLTETNAAPPELPETDVVASTSPVGHPGTLAVPSATAVLIGAPPAAVDVDAPKGTGPPNQTEPVAAGSTPLSGRLGILAVHSAADMLYALPTVGDADASWGTGTPPVVPPSPSLAVASVEGSTAADDPALAPVAATAMTPTSSVDDLISSLSTTNETSILYRAPSFGYPRSWITASSPSVAC
jgi:hypothetical protein